MDLVQQLCFSSLSPQALLALPYTSPPAGTTSSFVEISPLQSQVRSRDDDLFPTLSLRVDFCDIEQRLEIAFPHSEVLVSHLPGAFPFPTTQTQDVPAHQHDNYISDLHGAFFPSYLT